jgi:formylglycine-generating enzyme required for sulfatase activity
MGSDPAEDPNATMSEQPQHDLWLSAFEIAKYPVTNRQYSQFLNAVRHPPPSHWQSKTFKPGTDEHPVTSVSWHDAVQFCRWAGVRLASEAEWEKAARGLDGMLYPWGSSRPSEYLCNHANLIGATVPVTSYPQGQSPFQLFNMVGNTWEWTLSIPDRYPYEPDDGREQLRHPDERRVLRGGAYDSNISLVRCASRRFEAPKFYAPNIGFRVVRHETAKEN